MFVDGVSKKPVQTPSQEVASKEAPSVECPDPFSLPLDVFFLRRHRSEQLNA